MTASTTQNSKPKPTSTAIGSSILGKRSAAELDAEIDEEEREYNATLTEQLRRENSERCKSFVPNGKVEEFIALVGSDQHFVSMMIGANGTGKTAAGVNLMANIIYGPQNDYFQHPLFQNWPYTIRRGRIISDPTTIKEKIIPEIDKWFPAGTFEMQKLGKNYVTKILIPTRGWEIDLMSNEQDTKEFESVDLSFTWIDEPMPKDKFLATIARGRLGMIMFWTMTPLSYSAWIKDWLDENLGELAAYVEVELEDNCKVPSHGVRGILEHSNIKRMMDAYPEDEREARVFGKFGHLIGRVHKLFKRKIHVIPPFLLDPKKYCTFKAVDPHPRVPDHVLYMSVDARGTRYFTGEVITEGLVKELYARMKAYEEVMKYRMENRIIDPAAFVDDQHRKEKSVGSQLFDMGESYIKGSKDLMGGIKRTNDALNYTMREGKMVKAPEMYIFDTLIVTIKQLEEYVWQEHKGPSRDDKQPSGRPKDVNDHQVENMHRLLIHEFAYIRYVAAALPGTTTTYQDEIAKLDPYAKDPRSL